LSSQTPLKGLRFLLKEEERRESQFYFKAVSNQLFSPHLSSPGYGASFKTEEGSG